MNNKNKEELEQILMEMARKLSKEQLEPEQELNKLNTLIKLYDTLKEYKKLI